MIVAATRATSQINGHFMTWHMEQERSGLWVLTGGAAKTGGKWATPIRHYNRP